jgi:bla regulator protein BlaR1
MPALFVFLFKVNIALLLFCAGYYLVLRHLTFYTLNRIYLVAAILFASIYPQINLSGFFEHHRQIAKPVEVIILNWQVPAKAFIKPIALPNYWLWAEVVLWAGVLLFALRLLVQLYSLYKLYRSSTAAKIHNHDVRVINSDTGPFSFWKSIYINPAKHDPSDLRSILLHEQIHVSEWHTLDILLAELSTIFYWFNPGVWLMKKAVRENIEFITDRKILNTGTDSKQYQYSLVNVSFSAAPQGIVNHFNISTIKKRIIMMNAKRSSKFKLTRYAFLVPAVVALLLVFSISKAALVKKNSHGIKLFSAMTNKSIEKQAPKNIALKLIAPHNKTLTIQPLINKTTTDTIRKGKFSISITGKNDSINYVINGIKVTQGDLKALDANKIEDISVHSPGSLDKLIPDLDKKNSILCITTNDSEAGKKFKEKVDELNKNRYTVASNTSNPLSSANKIVLVSGTSNGSGIVLNDDDQANNIAIAGSNNGAAAVQAFDQNGNKHTTLTLRKNYKSGGLVTAYTIKGDTSNKAAVYTLSFDTATMGRKLNSKLYKSGAGYNSNATIAFATPRSTISHLSDKLIIINGKIASEADLKKISAFDIDRMVLKTDEETKELYGDKAKNGIVFIVTKKGVK